LRIYIVIPAYNEAGFIGQTLESLANQSFPPEKIVVVNDGSTDDTGQIVSQLSEKYNFISLVENIPKTDHHAPGSKVIKAFNKGLSHLDDDYDIICKFDADLIFPLNYLERIAFHFESNPKAGMVGGFCTIEKKKECGK
jgi:glycosyltransferase involved in cell wall biosynthesis